MKICVTGASGFIGQHVCKLLEEQGHYVVGLDMQKPADHVAMWLCQDVTKPLEARMDVAAVIHLAAIASPRECDTHPGRAYEVNVHGTYNVLELARQSGAHKFVFSSSAHVYGIPPRCLPTGEDSPLVPQSCYTLTKILGEELCKLYWQTHRLSYTVLRLFNTYGPGQGRGYFVPDMIAKAHAGNVIMASGTDTTKDFVYVEDVAWAFVAAVNQPFPGAFNIGSGRQYSLGEVASRIADHFNATFTCGYSASTQMQADISFAKSVLGWEPKVTLEEGLRATCEGAKSQPVPAQPSA